VREALFGAGFIVMVICAAAFYMSLDGADEALRATRRIGGWGLILGCGLVCASCSAWGWST
jgi:hypothetical protein